MGDSLSSTDPIQPDHYWDDGRIPVFKPKMEQFSDFHKFVLSIREFGMLSGIVKVIPPQEWVLGLPSLDQKIQTVKLGAPIEQCIAGSNGIYRQTNLEKRRGYTIAGWRKICETSEHLPPAKRGERRKTKYKLEKKKEKEKYLNDKSGRDSFGLTTAEREEFIDFDYRFDEEGMFTDERCKEMEKIYWKTLTYNSPLYGADLLGSLFDDQTKIWNVARLPNLLSNLPPIAGVNSAYLYLGMWKATFSWHVEDMDLYSINYIHFGAPKFWYSISQPDRHKFENVMRNMFPTDYAMCSQFLRHKTFHASPSVLAQHGITVNKLVHHQHEFVITFPFGYHAGFNMGYNCAESVNFALEDWLEFGKKAKKCKCIPDAVTIDINDLFARVENFAFSDKAATKAERRSHKRKREETLIESKKERPQIKKLKKEYECLLCPNQVKEEPLLSTKFPIGKFAHRICAAYIPETYTEIDSTTGNDIVRGIETIGKARYALKCLHCRQSYGACFQCSNAKCVRAYHPTCAAYAGSLVRMFEVEGGTQQMHIDYRCRFHRPKRVNVDMLEDSEETKTYCNALGVGDLVQFSFSIGRICAGRIVEIRSSEQMLLIQGENGFEWKRILVPPSDPPVDFAPPANSKSSSDNTKGNDKPPKIQSKKHSTESTLLAVPNYSSTGFLDTLANCVLASQSLPVSSLSFSRLSGTSSPGCLPVVSTERWSSKEAQYMTPTLNVTASAKTSQQGLTSEFPVQTCPGKQSLTSVSPEDEKHHNGSVKNEPQDKSIEKTSALSVWTPSSVSSVANVEQTTGDNHHPPIQTMPPRDNSVCKDVPEHTTHQPLYSQLSHPVHFPVHQELEFSGLKYHIPNGRTMNVEYINPQRKN